MNKKCNRCLSEKELSLFGKNKYTYDGLYSLCKECASKTQKIYREKNKEKIKLKIKEWGIKNIEKRRSYSAKSRANNLEKRRKADRDYKRKLRKIPEIRIKINNNMKLWRNKFPERVKNNHLKSRYGITLEEYNNKFIEQNESCAICKIHQDDIKICLSVDHCHKTGKIRGLLCSSCNILLGKAKDDIFILKESISYLKKYV